MNICLLVNLLVIDRPQPLHSSIAWGLCHRLDQQNEPNHKKPKKPLPTIKPPDFFYFNLSICQNIALVWCRAFGCWENQCGQWRRQEREAWEGMMVSFKVTKDYSAFPYYLRSRVILLSSLCLAFLFPWAYIYLFRDAREKKGKVRGPGTANMGSDAGRFAAQGLPSTD